MGVRNLTCAYASLRTLTQAYVTFRSLHELHHVMKSFSLFPNRQHSIKSSRIFSCKPNNNERQTLPPAHPCRSEPRVGEGVYDR